MKKLLVIASLIFTGAAAYAGTGTVWVRGTSAAQVEAKALQVAQQINSGQYRGSMQGSCSRHDRSVKVYAVSGVSKSYRADRYGNLSPQYTAVVKVRCQGGDDD